MKDGDLGAAPRSVEKIELFIGIGQMLPGPNTINAAVLIGDRFPGVTGVVLCLLEPASCSARRSGSSAMAA